ncbi:MAG: hypothetical protein MJK04_11625 [Psychrosphaera sp.]|nr:hypothetical protein [Psychrosphaera sp.]
MTTYNALSTLKTRHLLLAIGVVSMLGCSATPADESIDYGDEVDTPDVMIQDTDGKTTQYGDKNYGLAADAKELDQQNKPDQLEQGLASSKARIAHQPERQVTPTAPVKSQVSASQRVAPIPAKAESVAKVQKPKQKPKVTQEQRLKRDSALEVSDPLLGEVDPG